VVTVASRRLQSADNEYLIVPRSRLVNVDNSAVSVASLWIWNSMPVTGLSPVVNCIKGQLKTFLFPSLFDLLFSRQSCNLCMLALKTAIVGQLEDPLRWQCAGRNDAQSSHPCS
jgi:hypothetical protein